MNEILTLYAVLAVLGLACGVWLVVRGRRLCRCGHPRVDHAGYSGSCLVRTNGVLGFCVCQGWRAAEGG